MINIGKYIEMAINWLTENFTLFFDAINVGIGGFIDGFQNVLMWIPFYITIVLLTLLAWYNPKTVNTPTPFPDLYQARRVSSTIVI